MMSGKRENFNDTALDLPQALGGNPKAETLRAHIRSSRIMTIMASSLFLNPVMVMHGRRITLRSEIIGDVIEKKRVRDENAMA